MKILYILILLVFTGCALSKKTQLLKSGNVLQENYSDNINFDFQTGLPIIKVRINGTEANFLFDTGAPNVISIELASKLNLKTEITDYVGDSGENTNVQDYVLLDSVSIGNVTYLNTCAIVSNLSSTVPMSCYEIDGIIGTNLMRKSFWKMNYQEYKIYFSNDLINLKNSNDWDTLQFISNSSGKLFVNVKINEVNVKEVIFDTGSDGSFNLSKDVYNELRNEKLLTTYSLGSSAFGIFGLSKGDTTFYSRIETIKLGKVEATKEVIKFNKSKNFIGSKFLLNYSIILDWENNLIYMKKVSEKPPTAFESFGIKLILKDNKVLIGSLFQNSIAIDKLEIGDEIIELNGENYQDLSESTLCDLYLSGTSNFKKLNNLNLKIKRVDKIINVNLQKEVLLK